LKKLKVENSREFPREFEHSGILGIPVRGFPVALAWSLTGGIFSFSCGVAAR